jgi:uncharacterized protein with FMN-binding domain
MKRLILSITGTIAGLIALLSFKTHAPVTADAALPTAALGGTTSATAEPSAPTSPSTAAPVTRSYLGSAVTTRYGVIQVKVTVKAKTITNVSFVQLTAFDGRSEQINSYAAPQLLQETLSAQSADIDTISGASYTSDGYKQSLQAALDKAGI